MSHPSPPPIQVLLVEDDLGDALLVEEHLARCSIPVSLAHVTTVAAGAEDYLAKNEVDPALLERSIRYAIERHRTRDTARQLLETELRHEENLRLERGLLPRPLLDDAGLIATTRYRAGGGNRVIGGDFFDTVERADGSVRAVIGDVCGHGPDEAALGVNMRIAWRTLVLAEVDDESVLPMLERLLVVERGEDLFVTVCDVTVAADRRRVEYRLAGHPAPLVIEGDTVEEVAGDDRGVPLGVIADGRWPTRTREVSTPWTFLMFTDGLFEGRRGAGPERLGVEGLMGLLRDALPLGPRSDHLDALLETVQRMHGGPLDDDVALVELRATASP